MSHDEAQKFFFYRSEGSLEKWPDDPPPSWASWVFFNVWAKRFDPYPRGDGDGLQKGDLLYPIIRDPDDRVIAELRVSTVIHEEIKSKKEALRKLECIFGDSWGFEIHRASKHPKYLFAFNFDVVREINIPCHEVLHNRGNFNRSGYIRFDLVEKNHPQIKEWLDESFKSTKKRTLRKAFTLKEKYSSEIPAPLKRVPIGASTRREIYRVFHDKGSKCENHYCKKPKADEYHIDHKNPYVDSQDNSKENLWVLCATCNLKKGDTDFVVWEKEQEKLWRTRKK